MENDTEEYIRLKKLCFSYLMNKNYEAEIYEYSSDVLSESAALFILIMGDKTETVSRAVRSNNSASYVIALLNNPSELKKAVTPGISPSGLLIKPCERSDVEMVLDEIYTDHMRCSADNHKLGIFTFRQKAKEYSLPFEKILLFESRNKKIFVRTEIQEFEFYSTLDSVLQTAPDCFVQIHKSFVVNISRIVSADYGAMTVEFDDGSVAFISRTYKNELKERLNKRGEA